MKKIKTLLSNLIYKAVFEVVEDELNKTINIIEGNNVHITKLNYIPAIGTKINFKTSYNENSLFLIKDVIQSQTGSIITLVCELLYKENI